MVNYKISVISYLNSIPFVHGLNMSSISKSLILQLDYPSVCADKLINNVVDIGLVPVVILKDYPSFKIISEYCIGANGDVDTVCLFSNVPIQDVKNIYLDYQSRTSVELLKILCREYWKITPLFKQSKIGFENNINKNTAALIIGDRAFHANHKYEFVYDLSKYWKKMTGLPFVFACWISNKEISKSFLLEFNNSLKRGISNIQESVKKEYENIKLLNNAEDYLNNKVSYTLDEKKRKGMNLFISKIK